MEQRSGRWMLFTVAITFRPTTPDLCLGTFRVPPLLLGICQEVDKKLEKGVFRVGYKSQTRQLKSSVSGPKGIKGFTTSGQSFESQWLCHDC